MPSLDTALTRLIAASDAAAVDPFHRVAFPDALDPSRLVMPEALISLYHHPIWGELSDAQRWALSLMETVNFFSINIHGERHLVAGLAQHLYRGRSPWDGQAASRYLQRFIHEENAHTYMLAEYCHRYHGRVLPDTGLSAGGEPLSRVGEELLFFGRTFVLEVFLSHLNARAMGDDSLDPTTRAVHRAHHGDEARHIAFDRAALAAISEALAESDAGGEREAIGARLGTYARLSLRRLYNPALYRKVGIAGGVDLIDQVRALPARRAIEARWLRPAASYLDRLGVDLGLDDAQDTPVEDAHERR